MRIGLSGVRIRSRFLRSSLNIRLPDEFERQLCWSQWGRLNTFIEEGENTGVKFSYQSVLLADYVVNPAESTMWNLEQLTYLTSTKAVMNQSLAPSFFAVRYFLNSVSRRHWQQCSPVWCTNSKTFSFYWNRAHFFFAYYTIYNTKWSKLLIMVSCFFYMQRTEVHCWNTWISTTIFGLLAIQWYVGMQSTMMANVN